MPKQLTTKRKAEGPHHGPKARPTKKLQKASSQPALNIPPRPASATDSSLSESPPPPSLTSGSSIEDSPSSKSSASTASIEKSSSTLSTTGACPTSMLQETRPNHGDAQEIKEITWQELDTMSREQLLAYSKSRGWKIPLDEKPVEYDSDDDPYQKAIDAYEMYGYTDGLILADL